MNEHIYPVFLEVARNARLYLLVTNQCHVRNLKPMIAPIFV